MKKIFAIATFLMALQGHGQQFSGSIWSPSPTASILGETTITMTNATCNMLAPGGACTLSGTTVASSAWPWLQTQFFTGTLSSGQTVVEASAPGTAYLVYNSTGQPLVFTSGSGLTVTIASSTVQLITTNDGVNYTTLQAALGACTTTATTGQILITEGPGCTSNPRILASTIGAGTITLNAISGLEAFQASPGNLQLLNLGGAQVVSLSDAGGGVIAVGAEAGGAFGGAIFYANGTGVLSGTLTAGGFIDSGLTPSTSPICANGSGGVLTNVGCSSGSSPISGLTAGYIPQAGSATTITANSHIDDGVTTSGTLTATEPFNVTLALSPDQTNTFTNAGSMFNKIVSTTKNYAASEYLGVANVLWTAGIYAGADYIVFPPSGVQLVDLNPYAPTGMQINSAGVGVFAGGVASSVYKATTIYTAGTLPACTSATLGDERVVSDSSTFPPVFMAGYVGGGSAYQPVVCVYTMGGTGSPYGWETY